MPPARQPSPQRADFAVVVSSPVLLAAGGAGSLISLPEVVVPAIQCLHTLFVDLYFGMCARSIVSQKRDAARCLLVLRALVRACDHGTVVSVQQMLAVRLPALLLGELDAATQFQVESRQYGGGLGEASAGDGGISAEEEPGTANDDDDDSDGGVDVPEENMAASASPEGSAFPESPRLTETAGGSPRSVVSERLDESMEGSQWSSVYDSFEDSGSFSQSAEAFAAPPPPSFAVPKLSLAIGGTPLPGMGKGDADVPSLLPSLVPRLSPTPKGASEVPAAAGASRRPSQHRLLRDEALHAAVVQLLLSLLVGSDGGLQPLFWARYAEQPIGELQPGLPPGPAAPKKK